MEEEREQQRFSAEAAGAEDDDSIEEIEIGGRNGADGDNDEDDLLLLLGEDDDDDPRSLALFEDVVSCSSSSPPSPSETFFSDSSYRGPGAILPASLFACGALALLRVFSRRGERSRRARAVATAVIERVNAADYSAWQLRWECSLEAGAGATPARAGRRRLLGLAGSESRLCSRVSARSGFKIYQLWNHRSKVVAEAARVDSECEEGEEGEGGEGTSGVASRIAREELSFACAALSDDAKNYHAWSHRCLVASQLPPPPPKRPSSPSSSSSPPRRRGWRPWADERDFAAGAISEDPRSNSAWAHRAAAVDALLLSMATTTGGDEGGEDERGRKRATRERNAKILEEEFELAREHARARPHDFPAWSHVRAVACWASELEEEEREEKKGKDEEEPRRRRWRRRKNLLPLSLASDARYASLAASVLAVEPGCAPALLLLHDAHALRSLWASKAAVAGAEAATKGASASSSSAAAAAAAAASAAAAETSAAVAAACRSRLAEVDPTRVGLWASIG